MQNKLEDMFARQLELGDHFIPMKALYKNECGDILGDGDNRVDQREKYILSYITLLIEEAVEMQRTIPSRKFWRKEICSKPMDAVEFREELADVLHILIAISVIAGIGPEELHELYVAKNQINLERLNAK